MSVHNRNGGKARASFLPEPKLEHIKEGLRQIFPTLYDLNKLELLSNGFNSYVVLIADQMILRIAKNSEAMEGHKKEWAILPPLQDYISFQVPEPVLRAEPSEFFPFGVIGYQVIPGIPFSLKLVSDVHLKQIAQDLAKFLVTLHSFPLDKAMALGIGQFNDLESLRREVMPTLSTLLAKDEYEKIISWWESYLKSLAKDSFTPKLIHGDPWCENIILNETLDRVVGIVDFESVIIGDVAQDFAAQKYIGQDFLSEAVKHYRKLGGELSRHFSTRLQESSMLRELRGLRYAIKYPESGELEDCLQKIRYELLLAI